MCRPMNHGVEYRMYRCGFCGLFSEARQKMVKVTIQSRQRNYDCRDINGDPYQSVGYEIVRETSGHPECAERAVETEGGSVKRIAIASKTAGNAIRIRRFLASRQTEVEDDEL